METVLIIEDDPAMLRALKDNFEFEGYIVKTATDGEKGLDAVLKIKPDLLILDLMLPRINGYEICQRVRKEKLDLPIIMLTAKGQESDIVLGLNVGADDYVTKPFSIRELLARAAAFLRRRREEEPQVFRFGKCELDTAAHRFTRGGKEVPLSPKEFDLLHFFLKRPGRAFSREEILNTVWGYDKLVTPRSIDRFINALRNIIESDSQHPKHLLTIREVGYKFEM
ncbi:MAG TPA: response regulator transcription factor [Chthoniobacteraceae bacterium]|nr:response regulator transcription factor [Chthoniobacteraceae bacterium]